MKTTTFIIDFINVTLIPNTNEADINIDLLPAFAIDHCILSINGVNYHTDFTLNNNIVHWDGAFALQNNDELILTIIYFGIRDYQLLFPWITNQDLKIRLGEFYREAEINFENCCWLSYALMCGALYEGILFAKYPLRNQRGLYYTFKQLIDHAHNATCIDITSKNLMNKTRDIRNLVHANNHVRPFVSRLEAMDMRTTMDSLIKYIR
ncbi:MAG: hypothetical protein Q8861_07695 [Bacteroidota bacterium]|nr:hypothetical protein [Bacteroidota bacterium]